MHYRWRWASLIFKYFLDIALSCSCMYPIATTQSSADTNRHSQQTTHSRIHTDHTVLNYRHKYIFTLTLYIGGWEQSLFPLVRVLKEIHIFEKTFFQCLMWWDQIKTNPIPTHWEIDLLTRLHKVHPHDSNHSFVFYSELCRDNAVLIGLTGNQLTSQLTLINHHYFFLSYAKTLSVTSEKEDQVA